MITTTSRRLTSSDTPLRTSRRPKDLWTSLAETITGCVSTGTPTTSSRSDADLDQSARPAEVAVRLGRRKPEQASAKPGPFATGAPGVPFARRRSIRAWMKLQIVVSSRNQTAQARNSSNGWNEVGPLPFRIEKITNSSGTEMMTSSDVVLSMLLNSLPSGGTMTRAAWGSTIRRIALA